MSFKRQIVALWVGLLPIVCAYYLYKCKVWYILLGIAAVGAFIYWLICRFTTDEQWKEWRQKYIIPAMWICRLYPLDPEHVMLGRIVVLPEYRHRGLGTLVVKEAETWAKELGYTAAVLESRDNKIPFYERMGYVADKIRKNQCEFFKQTLILRAKRSLLRQKRRFSCHTR